MPQVGAIVITPEGRGTVVETFTLLEKVKVKVRLKDNTDDLLYFQVKEIEDTGEVDSAYEKVMELVQEVIDVEEIDIKSLED
nr:hypothetical protein [Tissierella sp. P1]